MQRNHRIELPYAAIDSKKNQTEITRQFMGQLVGQLINRPGFGTIRIVMLNNIRYYFLMTNAIVIYTLEKEPLLLPYNTLQHLF